MFPAQIRRKGISNQLRGLLEVEPLHFTCCAASEATRVENMDAATGGSQTNNVIEDILFESTPQSQIELGLMSGQQNATMSDSFSQQLVNMEENLKKTVKMVPNNIAAKDSKKNNVKVKFKFCLMVLIIFKRLQDNEEISNNEKNVIADKMFHSQIKNLKHKIIKSLVEVGEITKADPKYVSLKNYKNYKANNAVQNATSVNDENTSPTPTTTPTLTNEKIQEFVAENNLSEDASVAIPWHKLLSFPPKQMIVIDRLHSGARRFITLDFGSPIMLTDVVSICTRT